MALIDHFSHHLSFLLRRREGDAEGATELDRPPHRRPIHAHLVSAGAPQFRYHKGERAADAFSCALGSAIANLIKLICTRKKRRKKKQTENSQLKRQRYAMQMSSRRQSSAVIAAVAAPRAIYLGLFVMQSWQLFWRRRSYLGSKNSRF